MLTAQQVTEKWEKNAKNGATDYVNGVKAVKEAPAMKAIAQKDKMRQNILAAIDSGKWETNLGKVGLTDWINKTVAKGSTRYSTGITEGKEKMKSFLTEFIPHLEAGKATIDAMADMTIDDSIARAAAQIRHNHSFKRS